MENKRSYKEVCDCLANIAPKTKELTYGRNGYPEFGGHSRRAFYGFDSMADVENLRDKIGCGNIEVIEYRDGHTLARSTGETCSPFTVSPETYGDDYNEWFSPEDEFSFLREQIEELTDNPSVILSPSITTFDELNKACQKAISSECGDWSEQDEGKINKLLENYSKCFEAFQKLELGQIVLTENGEFAEVVDTQSISLVNDTHNKYIALVVDSNDFPGLFIKEQIEFIDKHGLIGVSPVAATAVKSASNGVQKQVKEQTQSL